MKITCTVRRPLPTEVRESAERRAAFQLSRFADVVRRVRITVEDLNGPRGGVDTQCRVSITLDRYAPIVVSATAETIGDAVAGALDRAARGVARMLDKRSRRRQYRRSLASIMSETV
jgi:hypothetical protein